MEPQTWGWFGLFLALIVTTFGIFWSVTTVLACLLFSLSIVTVLYVKQGNVERCFSKCAGNNPLTSDFIGQGGLNNVVKQLSSPRKTPKTDSRVTGSDLIDSSLQEILGYIVRDYISPWYSLISRDTEFAELSVRWTAQTFAINISNRVKEIDWIPYLTTRFVDDVATHLRLFKQARAKMKFREKPKSHSPAREQKGSPKKATHKRNKSETDINWYHGKDRKEAEFKVGNSKFYDKNDCLEDYFFELECQMENSLICRDNVSMDIKKEKEFLCEIMEILLYILLPDADFQCRPVRYILREIFANYVISPLFTLLSDPDYINQAIIWLCLQETALPSEIFLTTLRITDNSKELKATKELVTREIQQLRSRDSGGDSDLAIKQQLSSLFYVLKLIDNRLLKMDDCEPRNSELNMENVRKIDLRLDQIVKNNVALSYFIDFASTQGHQIDLYFFLNIQGWKVSVEQLLSDLHTNKIKGLPDNSASVYDSIRSTASSIFEQYLGELSDCRVQIKPALVQTLQFKIRNLHETPIETWFDDVQKEIYTRMEIDFLPAFKQSRSYLKLLQELDLVPQNPAEEDAISVNSIDSLEEQQQFNGKSVKHARSFSDVTVFQAQDLVKFPVKPEGNLKSGEYVITVSIIETGIVCEKGKTFGIYAVHVSKQYETGFLEEWHIYRRYSDFHDLYTKVKEKYSELAKLPFPAKKTFHNMDRAVLERRMKMLGDYMQKLCQPATIKSHPKIEELINCFLEQGDYDRATGGPISSTITTLVNPLKSGMKTITKMPEQFMNTFDEVVFGGLSKVFTAKSGKIPETSKVGASIEETDDNIPLRIMLLLMDEVFDLKSRNQWLRRRIVTILRQIIRTMFGDIVNRRILDYVSFITSPKNVAHYLYLFKQSFWPQGVRSQRRSERDEDTRYRTRVAAKTALLSCITEELKHIIGSETTRRGVLTIFELFQRPILNRRLLFVLFEGILVTLFPEKDMFDKFQTLHSKSKQRQANKNTQTRR